MNIKNTLNLLFSDGENKIAYEVANEQEDGTFTVLIRDIDVVDVAYVARVLEAVGFVPVPELISSEVASLGGLEYSNIPNIKEAYQDEIEEASVEFTEEEEEPAFSNEMADAIAERVLAKLPGKTKSAAEIALGSIDAVTDDTKLKVIGNPEMMKFANKVFDMISPGDDKSNYAAFLYNFDDFLMMHQPDTTPGTSEEDEEPSSISESASAVANDAIPKEVRGASLYSTEGMRPEEVASFVTLFGSISTASAFLEDFKAYLPAEIAKGKGARGELLSAFMKGMSGESGIAAVAAWEAGDAAKLRGSLEEVVSGVVAKVGGGA